MSVRIDPAETIALAQALAAFASPQTVYLERDPQVQTFLSECICANLDAFGLSWRRDAMGGVLAEIGPPTTPVAIVFVCYAMTHPAARMVDPFAATVVDGPGGRVRGRGLAEQKGALAAAVAAFAHVGRRSRLTRRAVLAITPAGETGRHDAARAVVDALGEVPPLAVIAVGTGGRVALGNKGRIDVETIVRGHVSHSSTPWAGIDAILGARHVLDRVLSLDVGGRVHAGLGPATLTATSVRSWPEATHTVQDEVHLIFDRRLLPGDNAEACFAAIRDAAAIGPPWTVETRLGAVMLPAEVDPDGPLLRAIARAHGSSGQTRPGTFFAHGCLDAGLFCSLGCEAAMWGPGASEDWHSEDEGVSLDQLISVTDGYASLIEATAGAVA